MATSKKRKYQRRETKQYTYVEFDTEMFEDRFKLPDQKHMNLGLVAALNDGNIGKLVEWLRSAQVDEDALEAIQSLEQGEVQSFIESWSGGSLTTLGESEG